MLLALAACVAEYVPSYQRARAKRYQAQLSAATGCTAEVDAVELRAPNRFILHGIRLFHPETSELIVRMQSLDVVRSPAGYALRLINPELAAEHLATTYRLLHEQVLCRPVKQNQAVVAWLDGLALHSSIAGRTQFRNVRLELKRLTTQTQANLDFGLDGVGGQPATIAFSRQHTSSQPTTHLTLLSGGQRLPGHWISYFAPQLAVPGDRATFTGQFELDYVLANWSLKGAGELRDVDTAAWTQRPMVSGFANLKVTDFSLTDQGLDHVYAHLAIEDGRVQDELLQAANFIGIAPASAIAQSTNRAHPFTQLALEFSLDSRGLVLKAGLSDRAIVSDQLGPLAQQYHVGIVPMSNLITTLAKTASPDNNNNDLVSSPTVRRLVHWLPQPVTEIANEQSSYQASAVER